MYRAVFEAELTEADLQFFSATRQTKEIPDGMSASFARLQRSWERFIDELLFEWNGVVCFTGLVPL